MLEAVKLMSLIVSNEAPYYKLTFILVTSSSPRSGIRGRYAMQVVVVLVMAGLLSDGTK